MIIAGRRPTFARSAIILLLLAIGSGTERIEQALKSFVPQARVARMDRDTTTQARLS